MEAVINMVTGPLGALALSVGILWWLANKIVPVIEKYLTDQNVKLGGLVSALEKTVDAHEKDRETFTQTIAGITRRLDKVEDDVNLIKDRVVVQKSRE